MSSERAEVRDILLGNSERVKLYDLNGVAVNRLESGVSIRSARVIYALRDAQEYNHGLAVSISQIHNEYVAHFHPLQAGEIETILRGDKQLQPFITAAYDTDLFVLTGEPELLSPFKRYSVSGVNTRHGYSHGLNGSINCSTSGRRTISVDANNELSDTRYTADLKDFHASLSSVCVGLLRGDSSVAALTATGTNGAEKTLLIQPFAFKPWFARKKYVAIAAQAANGAAVQSGPVRGSKCSQDGAFSPRLAVIEAKKALELCDAIISPESLDCAVALYPRPIVV